MGELANDAAALHTSDAAAPGDDAEATTLAEAPPSLRAAAIVAMQRGAGPQYDLDRVRDDAAGRSYEGELVAMGRVLRVDAAGAAIARGYDDEAELGLRLERAGCAGDAAAAGEAEPEVAQNRVSYARALGGGRGVEEWYVAGPLGLEQGYTIERSWGCAGELELDVAVRGARVEAGRREGELGLVSDASGGRFGYGELAAWDAEGTPLAARMEARDGGVRLVVDGAGAVFPVVVDPLVWTEQAKLVAGDAVLGGGFGHAVAISGDTALVGAPSDDHSGGVEGSAYVFVRSGTVWAEQAKLVANDAAGNDGFGAEVSLSGDTALLGAPFDDHALGLDAGSAYVFVRSGTTWTQQAKLVASDAALDDQFGFAVALDGDTALVGSYRDDDEGGLDSGSAYVFVRSGASWLEQAKLAASDAAGGDNFGIAVALAGDTALVGAFQADLAHGTNAGSAYVFVRNGGVWAEQVKLVASDADEGDGFGWPVAMSGETVLIGAPGNNELGHLSGSAYVFVRNGETWTEQAKLVASNAGMAVGFGGAVALAGDTALVGARSSVGHKGSAYVFARSGQTWSEQARLVASDAAGSDFFGSAVALAGDTALVGTPGRNLRSGVAFLFVLEDKLDRGEVCSDDLACLSGFCVSEVCCESECLRGICTDGVCGGFPRDGSSCRAVGAPIEGGAPPSAWIALAGLVMAARLRRRRAA